MSEIRTTLVGPFDNSVTVYHFNDLVWATIEQWCKVLQAPYFLEEKLRKAADAQAALLKGGPFTVKFDGVTAYRWPPIAAALDLWHRNWMVQVSKGEHATLQTTLRAESEAFARNVARLKAWGYELQERELQAAKSANTPVRPSASGVLDVAQAMEAIRLLAQATETVLVKHESELADHEGRLLEMKREMPAFRDPNEFVTVKQRCLERALPFGKIVAGRMNLTQACGQYMQKQACQKGASIQERLDGSSMITEVATWRRSDIDKAIQSYMPELPLPGQD
jgi:hypothetical protein